MESERIAPNVLFHSFIIVAGSYFISVVFLFLLFGIVSRFCFPETFEFLSLSAPDLTDEQIQNNADLVMPQNLFWILLGGHSLFCMAMGWLVTRFSPYAKFNHAVFVAVIIFVSFLQTAVKNSGDLQSMLLTMMCVFPISILIGAKIHGGRETS